MVPSIKRIVHLFSATLAIASVVAAAGGVHAQQTVRERIRPAFPEFSFAERQLSGQAAVDRLGARIGEVADWYGTTPERLRNQLLSDRRVRLDSKGKMFVVEEMAAPVASVNTGVQQNVMNGQLSPLDQTFLMHSRPGANRTIYLNFQGATITNTAWNTNGNTITAVPFDIDGDTTSFSTDELQRIQYIWQRVAEDYAPFDVDVTTEAPTQDRLTRIDGSDEVFGTTVVITNNAGVYNCSCGGIAYVGVFDSTSDRNKPAFVFYNMLGNGSEKPVAEAISHEAGHNMGLSHDGTSSNAYYGGQGTDPVTGWAPIMGVGYYKPLVQFSKGEYSGANNKEDDFAVMQSNGLPLRQDDYGNTTATASPFPAGGGTQDGVIERAGDVDMFSFTADAGTFNASVSPANRSGDADLVLSLLDRTGAVLATSNPLNALNASVSFQLPSGGTYYIAVTSTGQGDPTTTGYSAYGSVGNYRVTASFPQATGVPPTAVLTASATTGVAPVAITLDGSQSTDSDGTVKFYYWDFGDGTGDNTGTLQSVTHTYTTPGVYTAQLTVVDNSGYSSSAVQTISVASPASIKSVSVKSMFVTVKVSNKGVVKAKGTVVVVNQLGKAVSGAVVEASWGGVLEGTSALATRRGKANFLGPTTTTTTGCYTLTVTSITLAEYSFSPDTLPTTQVCR